MNAKRVKNANEVNEPCKRNSKMNNYISGHTQHMVSHSKQRLLKNIIWSNDLTLFVS